MKSLYADRPTIGQMYLDAQKNDPSGLLISDVGRDMVTSLIEDINNTIESNPFEGRPFYINVVEQKDLQMPNAIKRRLFVTLYRPYPEDNTLVFHVDPRKNEVKYCWDLPHHSELWNILHNPQYYDYEYVELIKNWMNGDLHNFGFKKVHIDNSSIDGYDEKVMNGYRNSYLEFCKNSGMNEKEVESERRNGFFWVPNPKYKDKDLKSKRSIIHS